MGICKCNRCGEDLTAPYFFKGKPYGWTCIKIVNPGARKPKVKDNWVKAESVYTVLEGSKPDKRKVVATYEGKRYADWHFYDYPPTCVVLTDDNCLINLSQYKQGRRS